MTVDSPRMDRRRSDANLKNYARNAVIGYVVLILGVFGTYTIGQSNDRAARSRDQITNQRSAAAILRSGNIIAVDGCNRDFRATKALRLVLRGGKRNVTKNLANGSITRKQAVEAFDFYDQALTQLPLPDCRDSLNVLSANPETKQEVPTPLNPETKQEVPTPLNPEANG
jgi:hypothetical protein